MKLRQKEFELYQKIESAIIQFKQEDSPLLGIDSLEKQNTLIRQLIDSIRRIDFVLALHSKQPSIRRTNPNDPIFDPIRAAIYYKDSNYDEACWLVFLFTHFGKSKSTGWRLCADIYSCLGADEIWTWDKIKNNLPAFKAWFRQASLSMQADGIPRHFGNHRKYESIRANANRSIDTVIESYVNWIGYSGQHSIKFAEAISLSGSDPKELFDYLYKSMKAVCSFGRTAKFDYLTMMKKVGLLDIEPPRLYLKEATGPLSGARLLFYGSGIAPVSADTLESKLALFSDYLGLDMLTMQVLEDALCNWQKSPSTYIYFNG